MAYSVSIAHLSDLHFGDKSRFRKKEPASLGRDCARAIKSAMQSTFKLDKPDLVVVTGDITQQANIWEFHHALQFFNGLQDALTIARSNFVFMPGNHDISWGVCKKYFENYPHKSANEYDPQLYEQKMWDFINFRNRFYENDPPALVINTERGAVLHVFENINLCIAALNSCEEETHEKHIGVISEPQAQAVMDGLYHDYKNYIKIIALHHAVNSKSDLADDYLENLKQSAESGKITLELLERFQSDALSVTGNAFINAIIEECRVHLVLHGHQHAEQQPHQVRWSPNQEEYCQICPSGSFGLKSDSLPPDQPNNLRLIHLADMENRLKLKSISLNYDPFARFPGKVGKGCFKPVEGLFEASFPFDLDSKSEMDLSPSGPVAEEQVAIEEDREIDVRVNVEDKSLPVGYVNQVKKDQFGYYEEITIHGINQVFRWIPPGRFLMGSPIDEPERYEDELQHEVELTCGFWLADTTCTQALWQVVMDENPSRFIGLERPVECVSWDDCQEFIERVNKNYRDLNLRLPTEAQWEYACRAGTTSPFWFGDTVNTGHVNFNGNYPYRGGVKGEYRECTVEVKTLPSNDWGLYEMHGNVWEWCSDWFGAYQEGLSTNPSGPSEGEARVLRGGSWFSRAGRCRSAYRSAGRPGDGYDGLGFRLSRGQEGK